MEETGGTFLIIQRKAGRKRKERREGTSDYASPFRALSHRIIRCTPRHFTLLSAREYTNPHSTDVYPEQDAKAGHVSGRCSELAHFGDTTSATAVTTRETNTRVHVRCQSACQLAILDT